MLADGKVILTNKMTQIRVHVISSLDFDLIFDRELDRYEYDYLKLKCTSTILSSGREREKTRLER